MQAYSNPSRESDPHALPDVEVFYMNANDIAAASQGTYWHEDESSYAEPGWYWWPCFPGCLPDGDPNGPFATQAEALADAQDNSDVDVDPEDSNVQP